jgi:LysR family hydrogen peroxide-inducible transcriptional activator
LNGISVPRQAYRHFFPFEVFRANQMPERNSSIGGILVVAVRINGLAGDLKKETMLLLGSGHCLRDQVLQVCPELMRFSASSAEGIQKTFEGSSLETIRHMVASGAGIAVMPSSAADPLMTKEPMVKVLPFAQAAKKQGADLALDTAGRTVGLAWRTTFPRPKAIDAVRQAILSCQLPGVSKAH